MIEDQMNLRLKDHVIYQKVFDALQLPISFQLIKLSFATPNKFVQNKAQY